MLEKMAVPLFMDSGIYYQAIVVETNKDGYYIYVLCKNASLSIAQEIFACCWYRFTAQEYQTISLSYVIPYFKRDICVMYQNEFINNHKNENPTTQIVSEICLN